MRLQNIGKKVPYIIFFNMVYKFTLTRFKITIYNFIKLQYKTIIS